MNDKVKLIECIRTWQGEGIDSGKRMLLCRFKHCNLNCHFCDTLTKMRISREGEYELKDLQSEIHRHKLGIMITGGEPTFGLQYEESLLLLNKLDYTIANVESNGYQLKELIEATSESKDANFMFSPKIFDQKSLDIAVDKTRDLLEFDNLYIKIVLIKNLKK